MLTLKSEKMELRAINSQVSKKTKQPYYIILAEDASSEQHKFVCKDFNAMPQGLKKGDSVSLTLEYNMFKDLVVLKVEKVG